VRSFNINDLPQVKLWWQKKCSKQKLFQDRKSSKDDRVKVTKSSINNNQGYEKESIGVFFS